MFTHINSAAVLGLDCTLITVEVDVGPRWPGFKIVGLGDTAIQEAKERIRTAWKNTELHFPHNAGIVINLAPADVRKEGSAYDLPIAVGMYVATENMEHLNLRDALFVGELALDGSLRHTNGILPLAIFASQNGYKRIFVPATNAKEASIISDVQVYPVKSFHELINHFNNIEVIKPLDPISIEKLFEHSTHEMDMSHIKGQEFVKSA
ncbi:magnesium chelatase, partial [Candidatus Parcubacteria bacterium]